MLLRRTIVTALLLFASARAVADTRKEAKKPAPPPAALPGLPELLPPPPPPAPAAPAAKPGGPSAFQLGIYQLVPAGTAADPALQSIEDIFLDVAQASKRYRSVVKLNKPPKLCDMEDDNCFALLGGFQQLDQVLVGEILKLQNGAAVKVRLVDVQKGKAIGQKALTVQTEERPRSRPGPRHWLVIF
jgi:hypothetical protein